MTAEECIVLCCAVLCRAVWHSGASGISLPKITHSHSQLSCWKLPKWQESQNRVSTSTELSSEQALSTQRPHTVTSLAQAASCRPDSEIDTNTHTHSLSPSLSLFPHSARFAHCPLSCSSLSLFSFASRPSSPLLQVIAITSTHYHTRVCNNAFYHQNTSTPNTAVLSRFCTAIALVLFYDASRLQSPPTTSASV